MANLLDRLAAAYKAFRLGPAVVYAHEGAWGHSRAIETTRDAEFIAKSVGVYACANLRANALAGLPLRLYKEGAGDERTLVTKGKAHDLLRYVNPHWTYNRLWRMTELSLCMHGEAFWFLERGPSGKGTPTEIWWGRPDCTRVVTHPSKYIEGFMYEDNGQRLAFTPGEVIWFRYPNVLDQFSGLSPIAAARLSIETGIDAMRSNRRIFKRGLQMAGMLTPARDDQSWTAEQKDELVAMLDRRFAGVDKAHSVAVFSQAAKLQALSITPKDAEFIEMMRWGLGDVCRVYQVPPILVQDFTHATYSNADQAYTALWTNCMVPEAQMIQAEITEQFLPMFGAEADLAEFDTSKVSALQEDQDGVATRAMTYFSMGVPLNRVLQTFAPQLLPPGQDGYEWGDGPGGAARMPAAPPEPEPEPDDETPADKAKRALALVKALRHKGAIALGSVEHEVAWKAHARRAASHEEAIAEAVRGMFEDQRAAILADLRGEKSIEAKALDPFGLDRWMREFAARLLPVIRVAAEDAGEATMAEVGAGISFDVDRPEVSTFLQERAQRFAEEVNKTTWDRLKETLDEGRQAGEGIDQLAERVETTMGDRIRSSATTIAITETHGAMNGGALEAAKQSGVVTGKGWLAAIDGRERETHARAHERYQRDPIPLDANFHVGAGQGPCPGQIGRAEEDCNCRCTQTWVVDTGEEQRSVPSGVLEGLRHWLNGR